MKWQEFKAQDSTGPNDTDFLFRSYNTGPQGARFELLKEAHHTGEDLKKAISYIKRNFDFVKITVINETI